MDARRPEGFFSYTRADDDHDGGRLTDLRRALADEVSAQLGEEFVIFQDRSDVLWGQRWKARIEESVDSSTILVAAVTPRFLRSDACRSEVERFFDRERELGRNDLIFPIYYITVSDWESGGDDALARELASRQYVDWRPLRFEALDSAVARKRIAELAGQVLQTTLYTPLSHISPSDSSNNAAEEDESPGFLDLVAESEEAMPLFSQVVVDFAERLQSLSAIAQGRTEELTRIDQGPRPAAAKLSVLRSFGSDLEKPVAEMEALAADYVDQLARVDGGIQAMLERIPELTEAKDIAAAENLSDSLATLAEEADQGLSAMAEFRAIVSNLAQLSSTIRPVLRRMDRAVSLLLPSRVTFAQWAHGFRQELDALGSRSDGPGEG